MISDFCKLAFIYVRYKTALGESNLASSLDICSLLYLVLFWKQNHFQIIFPLAIEKFFMISITIAIVLINPETYDEYYT